MCFRQSRPCVSSVLDLWTTWYATNCLNIEHCSATNFRLMLCGNPGVCSLETTGCVCVCVVSLRTATLLLIFASRCISTVSFSLLWKRKHFPSFTPSFTPSLLSPHSIGAVQVCAHCHDGVPQHLLRLPELQVD